MLTRLFVIDIPIAPKKSDPEMSESSDDDGFVTRPTMKRMIADLDQSHIWQLKDIWLQIARLRINWINEIN